MGKKIAAAVFAFATVLVSVDALAGTVAIDAVVAGPGEQYWPSSDGEVVAYTEFRQQRSNAFVHVLGAEGRMRLNEPRTGGALGSVIAGTDLVVFQQWDRASDLYYYNLSTGRRSRIPEPVRSPEWEYLPVASERFVLFLRAVINDRRRVVREKLLLVDRTTDQRVVLVEDLGDHRTLYPGFAGDRYAAWTTCTRTTCAISYFDDTTGTTTQMPLPERKAQYAPAIDESDGTVYYTQSPASRCGVNVMIRRATLGADDAVTIATLPDGIDTGWTLSLAPNSDTASKDIYFERWRCEGTTGDIFALRSVDAVTSRVPGGSHVDIRGARAAWQRKLAVSRDAGAPYHPPSR
jgi:hypothetical protein